MDKAAHFSGRLIEGINALSEEIDTRTTTPEALLDVLDKNPKFRSFSRMLTIVVMQSYYQDPEGADRSRAVGSTALSAGP